MIQSIWAMKVFYQNPCGCKESPRIEILGHEKLLLLPGLKIVFILALLLELHPNSLQPLL